MFGFQRLATTVLSAALLFSTVSASKAPKPTCGDDQDAKTIGYLNDMFNVLNTAGWTNFTSYLTDDLIWTVTGETPISGNWTSRQQYIDNVFTPLNNYLAVWPTPVIVRTITQGDWATVLFDGQNGLGKNGLDYSMPYSWLMNVDTSLTTPAKIKQVVGFYDHVKVIQLFNTSYVASS